MKNVVAVAILSLSAAAILSDRTSRATRQLVIEREENAVLERRVENLRCVIAEQKKCFDEYSHEVSA